MEQEHRTFGWRQLLGAVNLHDFAQMVGGELSMIASSLRQAVAAAPRLPIGPIIALAFVLLAVLRLALLIVVIVVFGVAITIISAVRSIARVFRAPGTWSK